MPCSALSVPIARDDLRQHHRGDRLVERGHDERALQQLGHRGERRDLDHVAPAASRRGRCRRSGGSRRTARAAPAAAPSHALDGLTDELDPARRVALVVALEREPVDQGLAVRRAAEHAAQREAELVRVLGRVHRARRCILARARRAAARAACRRYRRGSGTRRAARDPVTPSRTARAATRRTRHRTRPRRRPGSARTAAARRTHPR